MSRLPTVIVPVQNALESLDACLAALDRCLPPGAPVLLADDASSDRRVVQFMDHWRQTTRLSVCIKRRERARGLPENCNQAFAETGDADVVLLHTDTEVTCGWLEQLQRCAASDTTIASATPWGNDAEICSLPRFCEPNPVPDDPQLFAEATAQSAPDYPGLPTAVGHCVYLRRGALRQLGGFDAHTYRQGQGLLNDWCLRTAAMGWRHVLCDSAYVVHRGRKSADPESAMAEGDDLEYLNVRWPHYQETIARFIMSDPLYPQRQRVANALQALRDGGPQRDLFGLSP